MNLHLDMHSHQRRTVAFRLSYNPPFIPSPLLVGIFWGVKRKNGLMVMLAMRSQWCESPHYRIFSLIFAQLDTTLSTHVKGDQQISCSREENRCPRNYEDGMCDVIVIADFTTLGESHIVWPSPVPLQTH